MLQEGKQLAPLAGQRKLVRQRRQASGPVVVLELGQSDQPATQVRPGFTPGCDLSRRSASAKYPIEKPPMT